MQFSHLLNRRGCLGIHTFLLQEFLPSSMHSYVNISQPILHWQKKCVLNGRYCEGLNAAMVYFGEWLRYDNWENTCKVAVWMHSFSPVTSHPNKFAIHPTSIRKLSWQLFSLPWIEVAGNIQTQHEISLLLFISGSFTAVDWGLPKQDSLLQMMLIWSREEYSSKNPRVGHPEQFICPSP